MSLLRVAVPRARIQIRRVWQSHKSLDQIGNQVSIFVIFPVSWINIQRAQIGKLAREAAAAAAAEAAAEAHRKPYKPRNSTRRHNCPVYQYFFLNGFVFFFPKGRDNIGHVIIGQPAIYAIRDGDIGVH